MARTAIAQTYLEPEIFVKMEAACLDNKESISRYIRRLVIKDMIDQQRMTSDDVMTVVGLGALVHGPYSHHADLRHLRHRAML
jgi:hypothetical protein